MVNGRDRVNGSPSALSPSVDEGEGARLSRCLGVRRGDVDPRARRQLVLAPSDRRIARRLPALRRLCSATHPHRRRDGTHGAPAGSIHSGMSFQCHGRFRGHSSHRGGAAALLLQRDQPVRGPARSELSGLAGLLGRHRSRSGEPYSHRQGRTPDIRRDPRPPAGTPPGQRDRSSVGDTRRTRRSKHAQRERLQHVGMRDSGGDHGGGAPGETGPPRGLPALG